MLIQQLWNQLRSRQERGAIAVEYGVLVAFVVIVIAAALILFGNAISDWLSGLANALGLNTLFQ